jgi:dUTP pyrophosphatase
MENDIPLLKKRKMSPESDSTTPQAPVTKLLIKRLSEKAKIPTRGSALAAGYDLYRYDQENILYISF